ncbi:hypothetical protein [Formosa sp. A9]|uniref:hypothetical protein n=1 Tax=Formosa sp. A9 TaxID=3442641 RepID=UPI003EBB07D7
MNIKKIILLLPAFVLLFGCPENDDTITQEETELQNVTHEVILFEFTPDTGNNSSRLRYEITFTNPNDIPVNGAHKVTLNIDGLISSNIATDSSPCYLIEGNSDCTISFDEEESLDLATINSIELVSVEYIFVN